MAETTEKLSSQRMGVMPEGKLLLAMALPMVLSMLTQAFYNVVDSIYVSMVSEDCLSALSLAFPAQNLMIGIGTGTGVGVGTLVSRALGARNSRQADRVAGCSVFLMVCCWLLLLLFGLFGAGPFICQQTDSPAIQSAGTAYLRIVTMGSLFCYSEIGFNRLLQATGLTKLSMWGQMVGAVSNIILDPFFIFGWCGLPAMGTAGAAIATVLGQMIGTAVAVTMNLRRNRELRIRLRDMLPDRRIIAGIYRIGLPSILMMVVNSFNNYFMNGILISFTSTAVAVFGVYFKLQSFTFMPVIGLNNAMVPIIGYNYGAGKRQRIYRTIRYAAIYASAVMLTGMVLFHAMPRTLLGIFSPSENMLAIGIPALRRISISFLFAGFCVVAGSACQALDKSFAAFFITVFRQLLVLLPAAYLLAQTGDVNMVWWAYPIAEIVSVVTSALFLRSALRGMERHMATAAGEREEENEA